MRSHRRSILFLPLIAVLAAAGVASPRPGADVVHVTGRVVGAADGAPLVGAQVYVPGTSIGSLTNAEGRYALRVPRTELRGKELPVVVTLIGYRTARSVVRVPPHTAGESVTLTADFRLETQAVELESLVAGAADEAAKRQARAASATVGTAAGAPTGFSTNAVGGHGGAFPHRPPYDREQYAFIEENDFRSVAEHPLSTFSIDVDRASYSNVRRFLLRDHRLPPRDAVQVEEMVNYFPYGYALPHGDDPVGVTTEVGEAPWAPGHRLLRVGLATRPVANGDLPPSNLVFLLDVSGSMGSPDKLPLVQASMRMLVEQLRPADRVAIVVYAGAAGVVLEPTPGTQKAVILEAIERLHAGGSTAGGEGLRLAYRVARGSFRQGGNNRVVLATDGDFNVGESSDAEMVRLIREKREQGTFLTVLGFGTGNLQNEKMQQLAQHGNGNYAYIDGLREAHKVLVGEMGGTLVTVAKDVKVQIEFNPARVRAYRLIGYENRLLAAEDFNDDRKDAGELGAGHTVTALYEVIPADVGPGAEPGAVDPLRYRAPGPVTDPSGGDELAFLKIRYKRPHGTQSRLLTHRIGAGSAVPSSDFTFAAAVAGFGMLLRGSEHRGSMTAPRVRALAEAGLGEDPDGHRRDFLELVRAYEWLKGGVAAEDGM